MSKNVVQWVVEKLSVDGEILFERTFDDRKEAEEIYESLKESAPNENISMYKSNKRFLVE